MKTHFEYVGLFVSTLMLEKYYTQIDASFFRRFTCVSAIVSQTNNKCADCLPPHAGPK